MALVLCLFARGAHAQNRTAFLIDRLVYPTRSGQPDDFRVRTNAALALGASSDAAAVPALCTALSDPSDVVRQAVAAALKRLGQRAAVGCLRGRLRIESNAAVKVQMTRAIEALAPTAPSDEAPSGIDVAPGKVEDAKYYVAIARVTNGTARPHADVDRLVSSSIRARLASLGGYRLAPAGESPSSARAQLTGRKLKGYYLMVSVDPFEYANGGLRVRVRVSVFSYPGKDLRGEVPASAAQPGVRPGDTGAEDNLLSALARRSAELFAQNFR